MTVITTDSAAQYPANGSATVYNVPFQFLDSDDLAVGLVDANGNFVAVGDGSYTVKGAGTQQGGTITFNTPPASGLIVDVRRGTPNQQQTNFSNLGSYLPENVTVGMDRLEMQIQDLVRRCYTFGVHGADTESLPWPALPGPGARKNTAFVWDSNGLPSIGILPTTALTQAIWDAFAAASSALPAAVGLGRTPEEIANGVTPTSYLFAFGNVRRYGADPSGGNIAATSTAFANALLCNTDVWVPAGTYGQNATLQLRSGQRVRGVGGASILTWANQDINQIVGTGITNTTVSGLNLKVTGTGSALSTALVLINGNSSYVTVENCEFSGHNYAGVWVLGSSNNIIRGNYLHDQSGGQQNSADIILTNDSGGVNLCQQNIVDGNQCCSVNSWFGVCVQQFYGNSITPNYNLVCNNRVTQKKAYGVLFYNVVTNAENCNTASGNYVENIQGAVLGGSAGAGIYVANQGGAVVVNNTIRNCCVLTSTATLTPAGIGINGGGLTPFVIDGNTIINPQHYYGIEASGCAAGGSIAGNTVLMNNGTPSTAIYSNTSSNLTVVGNTISINTALANTAGIDLAANGGNCTGNIAASNSITGAFRGLITDQTGGFTQSFVSITGNVIKGGSSSAVPMALAALSNGTVAGNTCAATTVPALSVSGCAIMRYTGNTLTTTGTKAVTFAGTCSASFFDKSNYSNTSIDNAGTGQVCEQFGTAAPATGYNSQQGDAIEQLTSVVGSMKRLRCTVAGNSGTWVSEGNL